MGASDCFLKEGISKPSLTACVVSQTTGGKNMVEGLCICSFQQIFVRPLQVTGTDNKHEEDMPMALQKLQV